MMTRKVFYQISRAKNLFGYTRARIEDKRKLVTLQNKRQQFNNIINEQKKVFCCYGNVKNVPMVLTVPYIFSLPK